MSKEWIRDNTDFLLSAALSICGELRDAEDVVQETVLAALMFLDGGGTMDNPKAWMTTVMRRKYYDMLRRKYQLPTVTMGEGFDIADEYDISQKMIAKEEAEQVRRSVAYLASSYRIIIAKHYFHGESVKKIADEMGIPEGTVKSRLCLGRRQLKKGFENMEKYTENSYIPQSLGISYTGSIGNDAEPVSLIENDVLAQNLLILAYDKPLSVSELSELIGIPAAYSEPVINKLCDGELMKRTGDGKVYTDFIIYNADDHVKYIKEQEAFASAHADAYCKAAGSAINELKKTTFYSERLERFAIIYIAVEGLDRSKGEIVKSHVNPDRPNGGSWTAFGVKRPHGYKLPADKQGKENYKYAGLRNTHVHKYLKNNELRIYNFETSLYPYPKHEGFEFKNFAEVEFNMLKLFYLIKNKIDPEDVDCDNRIIKAIPMLCERGFITTKNGAPELLIPCLSHDEEKEFYRICEEAATEFAKEVSAPLSEYIKGHKKEIPTHLKSVPEFMLSWFYEPNGMMFVYEAIARGLHPRDLGYPCPETVVVFD